MEIPASRRRIRNIGIAAHIDAGKTTLTERMLYVAGRIHRQGEVHDGAATMDYMEEERARGITISSAATTIDWKGHAIQIIDTPGHVDFTAEVERSLRVLDGAVAVFCAVGGVEAQSEAVWRQADAHGVPRVCFINKLDRIGADLERTVAAIRRRLGARPLVLQIPIGEGRRFRGLIDLVAWREVDFRAGRHRFRLRPIDPEHLSEAVAARERLLETLAEVSDPILEDILEGRVPLEAALREGVRAATIRGAATPVLCGSALRDIGVPPLLDAVCDYLPSPYEVEAARGRDPVTGREAVRPPDPAGPLAALAFKTLYDPCGDLTFLRIYSGAIRAGQRAYNPRLRREERAGRMYRMHAGRREPVARAEAGDIVAVTGLKRTRTGDTLCARREPVALEAIPFPEPVLSRAVAPVSASDAERLGAVLAALEREDPTLRRRFDPETGETIVSGMGELHLEIVLRRIEREHRIAVRASAPQIAYRRTLEGTAEVEARVVKQTGGRGQYAVVVLRFEGTGGGEIAFEDRTAGGVVPRAFVPAVERGIRRRAARRGEHPLVGFRATLLDGRHHAVDSSEIAFEAAGSLALEEALRRLTVRILEPVVRIHAFVPTSCLGAVLGDLDGRRAEIDRIAQEGTTAIIRGRAPLAGLACYATDLRSLTGGRGTSHLEPAGYAPVPDHLARDLAAPGVARAGGPRSAG